MSARLIIRSDDKQIQLSGPDIPLLCSVQGLHCFCFFVGWLHGKQRGLSMVSTCVRSLVLSFVLLVAGPAFAQELGLRSFPVPQHGVVKLQVPKSWKDKVSPTAGSTAPTITFTGGGQQAFEMSLTPTWRTWPANPQAAAAEIWLPVQQNAERLKPKAVEKELPIQEIK